MNRSGAGEHFWFSRVTPRADGEISSLWAMIAKGEAEGAMAALGESTSAIEHKLVWEMFADGPDRRRDFLYRRDQTGRYYVLSRRRPVAPPDLFDVESKPFAPALSAGDRLTFELRVNAVVTRKDKDGKPRRHDIVMDRLKPVPAGQRAESREAQTKSAAEDWLKAQGERAGFRLETLAMPSYRIDEFSPGRGRKKIRLGVLDLAGRLRIENPDLFLPALEEGFGKAKAFGCGLMLIRRA